MGRADDHHDPDGDSHFYSFTFRDAIHNKSVDFSDMDGYVVIVAVVPALPGIGQFHYDLLDHLHKDVHPYTTEMIYIPSSENYDDSVMINTKPSSKVHLFKNEKQNDNKLHPLVQYLLTIVHDKSIFDKDKANIFIVSYDGDQVMLLVSPTMDELLHQLSMILKTMDKTKIEL